MIKRIKKCANSRYICKNKIKCDTTKLENCEACFAWVMIVYEVMNNEYVVNTCIKIAVVYLVQTLI